MASTTKKGSKNRGAKLRGPVVKTSAAEQARTIAELRQQLAESLQRESATASENVRLFQELKESLEQQTATSEVLRAIASSLTDLQSVLDTIAENAARLCDADDVLVRRTDGVTYQTVAHFGPIPHSGDEIPVEIGSGPGRAILERRIVHVHDIQKADNEFPGARLYAIPQGIRTALAVPLLRDGVVIGVFHLRRLRVQPFTDNQIKLLQTFADQAVIAIENVRLFQELGDRNAELREALEHQTATAEVLGIISRSPTDVQPVLEAIVESAAKVCGIDDLGLRLREGNDFVSRAHFGPLPVPADRETASIDDPRFRWIAERGTLHIPDAREQNDFPWLGLVSGARTFLSVPLRQQGEVVGTLGARRTEVRPFTPAQIKLLETFADQAVIALENVRLFQELKESLVQQTATSEILGVIASSPTDIQPVLDIVAENAARVCDANDAMIRLVEGSMLRRVARHGPIPGSVASEIPIDRSSVNGRAVADGETIHVHDLLEEQVEFPEGKKRAIADRIRTVLATPLLRGGVAIGVIFIRRTEVRPFTDRQIALLKTFADQAVIAIENVRLFRELGERNAELREALEHQTATAEVLGIISRSPTDVQPVLDAIVESAARVCGIDDVVLRLIENDATVPRAHFGPIPIGLPISTRAPHYQWMRDHGALHIPDARAQNEFPVIGSSGIARTYLGAPLRQQGELIGVLNARRTEVRPFTSVQIKLLETFADQAVIAIENVRLFNELKESLEQQTATSEVLGVIASSPTDIQPVLNTVAENAVRVCGAEDALVWRLDGNTLRLAAIYGSLPSREIGAERPLDRGSLIGRAVMDRQTIHVDDLAAAAPEFPNAGGLITGDRTVLATPLLREGNPIGVIHIRRKEVRPFSDKQIALLKTFADQAVIAIENVRLFKELQVRNRDLTEALEQQTATSEILRVISSSPTDLQPVFQTILDNAVRLCEAQNGAMFRFDGETLRGVALYNVAPAMEAYALGTPFRPGRESAVRRVALERRLVHVPDVLADPELTAYRTGPYRDQGMRSVLAVPLLKENDLIGTIVIHRKEVRPFTDKQIALLKTFADQAVIAIENVRLFQELKEALEQQTATSEILGVIASSPTDIQPVLDAIAQSAAQVCGSDDATIRLLEGDEMFLAAHFGTIPPGGPGQRSLRPRSVGNEALLQRRTIHIPDLQAEAERFPDSSHMGRGIRTFLVTPLLREGTAIGVISIRRTEVKPFTDKQVALLETFASQAVIAIENVRLFKELEERNAELREALEHQTATSEVLGIISRSPTDVQPVLDAIVESAARVCGIDDVSLRLREGKSMVARAHFGPVTIPDRRHEMSLDEPWFDWMREHGTLHIPRRPHRAE